MKAIKLAWYMTGIVSLTRSKWQHLLLGIVCLLLTITGVVWLASWRAPLRQTGSFGDYTASITISRGQLQIDIFRTLPEDDFYQHREFSLPTFECLSTGVALLLCWRITRDSRRKKVRGFELHPLSQKA
jgi:hypothetical protein